MRSGGRCFAISCIRSINAGASMQPLLRRCCTALALTIVMAGCRATYETVQPDPGIFARAVGSPALRDSLARHVLARGMPRFVAATIFSRSVRDSMIAVPGIGSRQKLRESEGWGRQFNDPGIKVFLDEYSTDSGTLTVWYRYPDFYRMNLSRNDTLLLFWQGREFPSIIDCLQASDRLVLRSELQDLPIDSTYYCEVHYRDNPDAQVSYWYGLQLRSDRKTLKLPPSIPALYPIESIELDGDPITSFHWKMP
jgi:hypothetical protein